VTLDDRHVLLDAVPITSATGRVCYGLAAPGRVLATSNPVGFVLHRCAAQGGGPTGARQRAGH